MKKITPVFGPQELFEYDGVKDDTVVIISGEGFFLQFSNIDTALKYTAKNISAICFKVAERRIEETPEPKLWTWEDKKAGMLPDVGSTAQHKHRGIGIAEILVVKDGFIVVQYVSDNKILTFTNAMFLEYFNPIETPDEKAARLENEFVDSMVKELKVNIGSVSYQIVRSAIRHSYRKLSGDLPLVQAKAGA